MKGQHVSNLTLLRWIVGAMVLWYGLWFGAKVARAETVIFADSFDSPLGTNWQIVRNQQTVDPLKFCMNRNALAVWIQQQGKLKLRIDGPKCIMDLAPSNLDLRGIGKYQVSVRFFLEESTQMDRSIVFLWQDKNNWYDLKLFGNTIFIQKVVNGTAYQLPNSIRQYPFQLNREYELTIEVTRDQHINAWVDQQHVLDVNDQFPFISASERQMIALRGGVGDATKSVTIVDNLSVTAELPTSSITNLDVQIWKQNDPLWKDLEYDHAHLWSEIPTMSRWGCAVTSMAMILRYYGIDELPSGEALTPQTLNQWLKSQADGYFSGNLNWLAISRLSQLVSDRLQTPKLEFSRTDGTLSQIIEFAKQEILANKPVILGYPGHFFVADGVDAPGNTLLTKDPYYTYSKLNQRPTQSQVNTIRRFQPSHTDLSYIVFAGSPELEITVKNEAGRDVPLENATEFLSDPSGESTQTSPVANILYIQKPETGRYSVHLSQPEKRDYQLKIYSYDVAGGVQQQDEQGEVGPDGKSLEISYYKDGTSPAPSLSPSAIPTVSPSPTPSPHPLPGRLQTRLYRRILEELRYLQFLIETMQRFRFPLRSYYHQNVLHQLERLKKQTNWAES